MKYNYSKFPVNNEKKKKKRSKRVWIILKISVYKLLYKKKKIVPKKKNVSTMDYRENRR